MTTLYVPGTGETDTKKIIMSQQLVAGQTSTNTGDIATANTNIATNTTNIATNTAALAAFSGAWSTWSPTFTMSTVGGTPITAATSGTAARYIQIGKTVHFSLDATISNIGVGNNGAFLFTLPVTGVNASMVVAGGGKEVVTLGKLVQIQSNSATQVSVLIYDNTSLLTGGNGTRVLLGGTYEAA